MYRWLQCNVQASGFVKGSRSSRGSGDQRMCSNQNQYLHQRSFPNLAWITSFPLDERTMSESELLSQSVPNHQWMRMMESSAAEPCSWSPQNSCHLLITISALLMYLFFFNLLVIITGNHAAGVKCQSTWAPLSTITTNALLRWLLLTSSIRKFTLQIGASFVNCIDDFKQSRFWSGTYNP